MPTRPVEVYAWSLPAEDHPIGLYFFVIKQVPILFVFPNFFSQIVS